MASERKDAFIRKAVINIGEIAAASYFKKKRMPVDDLLWICSLCNQIIWEIDGTFDKHKTPAKDQQN